MGQHKLMIKEPTPPPHSTGLFPMTVLLALRFGGVNIRTFIPSLIMLLPMFHNLFFGIIWILPAKHSVKQNLFMDYSSKLNPVNVY